MECKKFQERINDFIFDRIEYSEDLEEFLEHAKSCQSCKEELEFYYSIFRGLEDVPAPDDSDEIRDSSSELQSIMDFYDEYFQKQKIMKKAGIVSGIVFIAMVLCTIVYVFCNVTGYL